MFSCSGRFHRKRIGVDQPNAYSMTSLGEPCEMNRVGNGIRQTPFPRAYGYMGSETIIHLPLRYLRGRKKRLAA